MVVLFFTRAPLFHQTYTLFRRFAGVSIALFAIYLIVACAPIQAGSGAAGAASSNANADQSTALGSLQHALHDYEKGSVAGLEALLPASFVGRASLLDAARRTLNEQKQVQVLLSEIKQSPASGSPASINARWEKRFVRLPAQTLALEKGTLSLTMRRTGAGRAAVWTVETLPADNPFTR